MSVFYKTNVVYFRSLPNCKKIGEGVYGEVFMYDSPHHGSTVLKVIPIEGDILVNMEPQKRYAEILSEIVITMELSALRDNPVNMCSGFTTLKHVWCMKGEYPQVLLNAWGVYDKEKGSENDDPIVFESEQLYIVFELGHGGRDLEAFVFTNASQAAAAFRQVNFNHINIINNLRGY